MKDSRKLQTMVGEIIFRFIGLLNHHDNPPGQHNTCFILYRSCDSHKGRDTIFEGHSRSQVRRHVMDTS